MKAYDYGVPMDDDEAEAQPIKRIPVEQSVDRIPPQTDQDKISGVLDWADLLHEQAHSPWGINWQTLQAAVIAIAAQAEWVEHAKVDSRYRQRIDTPMDEAESKDMPDHFPDDWSSKT